MVRFSSCQRRELPLELFDSDNILPDRIRSVGYQGLVSVLHLIVAIVNFRDGGHTSVLSSETTFSTSASVSRFEDATAPRPCQMFLLLAVT
jgi:hypothetical protein